MSGVRDTSPDNFEIGGTEFRLTPLSVEVAEDLTRPLAALLTPVAGVIGIEKASSGEDKIKLRAEAIMQALRSVPEALDNLKPIYAAFAKACKVNYLPNSDDPSKGRWVELRTVQNDIFRRDHSKRYMWLSKCIELEFGAFLAEIGLTVASLMGKTSSSDPSSPDGSPGGSGESPPTTE